MARPTIPTTSSSSSTITTTLTLENPSPSQPQQQPQQQTTLVLRLNPKKKVTWKEGTVDNEFLQRKSSKKCCIFHKEKSFDEDDSDDEDHPHHHHDHGYHKPDGGNYSGEAGPSGCGGHWFLDWFRFGFGIIVKSNYFFLSYICKQIVFWMWRGKILGFRKRLEKWELLILLLPFHNLGLYSNMPSVFYWGKVFSSSYIGDFRAPSVRPKMERNLGTDWIWNSFPSIIKFWGFLFLFFPRSKWSLGLWLRGNFKVLWFNCVYIHYVNVGWLQTSVWVSGSMLSNVLRSWTLFIFGQVFGLI